MAKKIIGLLAGVGFGLLLIGAGGIDSNFWTACLVMLFGVLLMLPFSFQITLEEDKE